MRWETALHTCRCHNFLSTRAFFVLDTALSSLGSAVQLCICVCVVYSGQGVQYMPSNQGARSRVFYVCYPLWCVCTAVSHSSSGAGGGNIDGIRRCEYPTDFDQTKCVRIGNEILIRCNSPIFEFVSILFYI